MILVVGCHVDCIVLLRLRCRNSVRRRRQVLRVVFSGGGFRDPRPSLRPKAARAAREEPRVRVRSHLLLLVVVQAAAKGADFLWPWLPRREDGSLMRLCFCASFQLCVGGDPPRCQRPSGMVVVLWTTTMRTKWRALPVLAPLRWARHTHIQKHTQTHTNRSRPHAHTQVTHTHTLGTEAMGLVVGCSFPGLFVVVELVAWLRRRFLPWRGGVGFIGRGPTPRHCPLDVGGRAWRGGCLG